MLFVDDMLIIGRRPLVDTTKLKIMKRWKYRNFGPLETFVEFQVTRDRSNLTIFIHQELYVKKLLERIGMKDCNGITTLLVAETVLKDLEEHEFLDNKFSAFYRQIIGSTVYLSNVA